nr:MAG TPA: hypothetical protein [Caudoviricetes sp.]DAJ33259.1 MAG TPA: hypothetical protein [Herelleviridae sp.]DAH09342.1 MAG TPA: hypothetical protein [Caudoviricetes sp.]DAI97153.1 MAG TPA: hypothetical protein [Caudoviricetes sp.]DAM25637.1 MAG TPA: hypothetical protein [Caudoviricetes sp.]
MLQSPKSILLRLTATLPKRRDAHCRKFDSE